MRMDTELLEDAGIMDYSLLIGVHRRHGDADKDKAAGRAALHTGRNGRGGPSTSELDNEYITEHDGTTEDDTDMEGVSVPISLSLASCSSSLN